MVATASLSERRNRKGIPRTTPEALIRRCRFCRVPVGYMQTLTPDSFGFPRRRFEALPNLAPMDGYYTCGGCKEAQS